MFPLFGLLVSRRILQSPDFLLVWKFFLQRSEKRQEFFVISRTQELPGLLKAVLLALLGKLSRLCAELLDGSLHRALDKLPVERTVDDDRGAPLELEDDEPARVADEEPER